MRFLLIDDNPFDRELIRRDLMHLFPDATYVEIIDRGTFEEALHTLNYTIVFTDYQLKWTNGLEVLKTIRQLSSDIPVIMVTDTGSEEIATEAMKNGLNDYLLKTHLARLPISVEECFRKQTLQKERHQLESQLQKAQKMESLGLLVSGIAHDFNNLLTAIMGYAQLGMYNLSPQHPLYEHFQHIQNRSDQGARMTRQLLSFARGTHLDPTQIFFDELFKSLQDFLQKLLGPTIDLHIQCDTGLQMVYADRTQIEQVLVNLCLNARDAMPNGGTLSIQGQNVELDASSLQTDMPPGSYILLTIADTGVGMDEQVQTRLFEPFFTTKEVGQGTGLGLAVVYGIMKQHHGSIQVQSSPDLGTTFSLYFPSTNGKPEEKSETLPLQKMIEGGSETILVVEDDPDVQLLTSEFLHDCGYKIILASDGEEGMRIFEENIATISLVIADVMMPKMRGKLLQESILQHGSTVKVLIVSGYQEMDLKRRELLDPQSHFLQKPFDLDKLAMKVRELIGNKINQ